RPPDGTTSRRALRCLGAAAELLERGAEVTRGLALRDVQPPRDLRLRQVAPEAQTDELALARVEARHQLVDVGPALARRELVLGARAGEAVRLGERHDRARPREGRARGLHVDAGRPRRFGHRRLAAERLRHGGGGAPKRRRALLLPSRDADRRDAVADVPAELAVDRGEREGREGHATRRVVAARRRDEPNRRDLDEIVERLPRAEVSTRPCTHERQMLRDEIGERVCALIHARIMRRSIEKRKGILVVCIARLTRGYFMGASDGGGRPSRGPGSFGRRWRRQPRSAMPRLRSPTRATPRRSRWTRRPSSLRRKRRPRTSPCRFGSGAPGTTARSTRRSRRSSATLSLPRPPRTRPRLRRARPPPPSPRTPRPGRPTSPSRFASAAPATPDPCPSRQPRRHLRPHPPPPRRPRQLHRRPKPLLQAIPRRRLLILHRRPRLRPTLPPPLLPSLLPRRRRLPRGSRRRGSGTGRGRAAIPVPVVLRRPAISRPRGGPGTGSSAVCAATFRPIRRKSFR